MTNKNKTSAAAAEPVKRGRGKPGNQSHTHETAPAAVPEPIKTGRGGLRDYSEARAKTVQRVRGEFLSDVFKPEITLTFKPKITLTHRTVTFNTACVNLLPEGQYVSISIDESNLRLIVEPTMDYDKNGLKFANFKNGRNVPRTCAAKDFCSILFDFMKWNPNAKYRILAIVQEFGDKKIVVFNLDEVQQVSSEI